MGLAAPRKRTKISHDPNNTNWSRSTSGFGHRILSSQGWTPGSCLGARNAAHAELFTAASTSHIRVILKDDNLGLGARNKHDLNEPTGLDAFKGLLGRLNGRSDADLAADERKREDIKLARYVANKWQAVRFVSGGLLVQEKPQAPVKVVQDDRWDPRSNVPKSATPDSKKISKRKDKSDCAPDDSTVGTQKRRSKESKKDRQARKDKRERKDLKRKRVEESGNPAVSSESKTSVSQKDVVSSEIPHATLPVAKASRERRPMGRHIFRGRHIEQKKRALMDDKSLNEIFMIKS